MTETSGPPPVTILCPKCHGDGAYKVPADGPLLQRLVVCDCAAGTKLIESRTSLVQ